MVTVLLDSVVLGPTCTPVPVNNNGILLISMPGSTVQSVNVPPGVPTIVNINVPTSGTAGSTTQPPTVVPFSVTATGVKSCQIQVSAPPAPAPPSPLCSPAAGTIPVNFAITDAARGAVASVPIVAVTNAGDRQTLFATNVGGGRYVLNALPVTTNPSAVALENGRLELFGGALVTLTYQPVSGAPIVRTLSITP